VYSSQALATAPGGQQDVQRLRGCDQDMGRFLGHLGPFGCLSVTGANGGPYLRQRCPRGFRQSGYFFQRRRQVLLDVVGQCLQGRHVDYLGRVGYLASEALAHQIIDAGQECGKSLARARGRSNQCVTALGDGRPPFDLSVGGFREPALEPLLDQGMESGDGHGEILAQRLDWIPLHNRRCSDISPGPNVIVANGASGFVRRRNWVCYVSGLRGYRHDRED